jgi:DNA topoisomerase-1
MLAGPDGPARHVLRANGSTLVKPGYIAVYQEGRDDALPKTTATRCCRPCRSAMRSAARGAPEQHFTEPPPRFTEASLVKALEEYGIGRPSTYASIISTLRDREYVEIENRRFTATDIGKIVGRFLSEHFHQYVDYGFTAAMEDELDAVARGEEAWTSAAGEVLEAVHHPGRADREERHARTGGAGARARPRPGQRQARHACAWAASARSCRSAPRTTSRSRAFAGLRPGQKMDTITLADASSCSSCRARSAATADGRDRAGGNRPLRPVHQVRQQVRLAQGGRSVHRHARACARSDRRQAAGRRQSHHPGFSGSRRSRC